MWPGRDDDMERAIVLAEKGVALDPGSAIARTRLAWVQGWHGNFDKAIEVYEKALSLEPDNAEVYAYFGETLNFTEQLEKATQLLQKAFQLEPLSPPSWDFMLGHSLYELRRYDEAVVRLLRCLDRAPFFPVSHLYLACAYVEMGRMAEANEQIRALLAKEPRYSLERLGRIYLYRNKTNRQRFFNNLGKAGLPEF